jgi:hypothetical protein
MPAFTKKEIALMRKLNTPAKVQDFLNSLEFNFEKNGETLKSPMMVIREGNAHCLEGAILGAYVLSLHGYSPRLIHLQTTGGDVDHVITIFKKEKLLGALSKTNHGVLRYREAIYKNIRELVMSYFHEYFLEDGRKTLRGYSAPLDLNVFEKDWEIAEEDLWGIDEELDNIKHYEIAPKSLFKKLRKADKVEIEAGKIVEYKK